LGGSFPGYDYYSVNAQGLNGNIRPYHYQKNLYRQNRKDKDDNRLIQHYPLTNGIDKPVGFRFINDFSNRYEYASGDFIIGSGNNPLSYEFKPEDIMTGETGKNGIKHNKLAGSKHIDWFTNTEVQNETAITFGLRKPNALGFNRDIDGAVGDQIGGFKITNESGVTYHFALPVYSYDEFMYTGKIDETNGLSFTQLTKKEKYAYTWLLTSITGPDYMDKNGDGLANEGDWGYWVNFEYGKWAEAYEWRNPGSGYHMDLDNEYQFFSKGKKEIYYLNYIKTASHTAVFVKDIRSDGKGSNPAYEEAVKIQGITYQSTDEGNFDVFTQSKNYSTCGFPPPQPCLNGTLNYQKYPVSQLQLKAIYLYDNTKFHFDNLSEVSDAFSLKRTYTYPGELHVQPQRILTIQEHFGNNIVDIYDVAQFPISLITPLEALFLIRIILYARGRQTVMLVT
jgi:hypothetical protein